MTWCAIELLNDDPNATFSADAFIGQARLEDDDTITFMFQSVPPRGARVRLVQIPEVPGDYWDGCPPEIDFGEEGPMSEIAQEYRKRGGRRR